MLCITLPGHYAAERRYILETLLSARLGQHLSLVIDPCATVTTIRCAGASGALRLEDGFFACPSKDWLQRASVPHGLSGVWSLDESLESARTIRSKLPILFGKPVASDGAWMSWREVTDGSSTEPTLSLSADLLGGAFFMLSRYEEIAAPARDAHERYPASASLAARAGFLDRPLVDEYVEVLWACMTRLWPGLKRPETHFEVFASHDVDIPMRFVMNHWFTRAWNLGRDLKRASWRSRPSILRRCAAVQLGDLEADPDYTFEWILNQAARHGRAHTFNMFAGRLNPRFDATYTIHHPLARRLVRRLHAEGHLIGLHGSYHTWWRPQMMTAEFDALRAVCTEEGIHQDTWTSRQHFLRWGTPQTARALENAGVDIDTTLGFADRAGFRCGTCHPFPMFDLRARQTLRLQQRPLIVMECTVLDDRYMGMYADPDAALELMETFKARCRRVNGQFTILWHNNRLRDPVERRLFEAILC